MSEPGLFTGTMVGGGIGGFVGVIAGAVAFAGSFAGSNAPSGNVILTLLAALFWSVIYGLIPSIICGSIGSLIGGLTRRPVVGVAVGGSFGLLVAFGAPPSFFVFAAALCWTSGAVGGWFGAYERTRGPGRIRPRFRLLDAMIYVAIAALHLGIFLWLRGRG